MKKTMKVVLGSVLALMLTVSPALAAAEAGNSTTGANSENESKIEVKREVSIKNSNSSSVTNTVSSWVNSGYNSTSYNTGNGTINTGDAKWGNSLTTKANCSESEVVMPEASDPSAINEETGANSENEAKVEIENEVELDNENNSLIVNTAVVYVDSGFNAADYNTGNGGVAAGKATGMAGWTTETNANSAFVSGSADGDHEASNENTGYDSENEAEVDIENETELDNFNDSLLSNYFNAWIDSGVNSASYNTGNGTVVADDSESVLGMINRANGNFAVIEGGVGDTEASVSNDTTGAESDNEAEVEVKNEVEIDNENWGYIDNAVLTSAISGWNTADYNTGNALVVAEDSGTEVGVENVLNTNNAQVGDNHPLVSSGEAFNGWTGAESDNEAEVKTENTLEIDNDNNDSMSGGISNFVTADSLSGYNSGSYNTGNSGIGTGKSDVEVELASDENSNVTLFAGFGANTDSVWNSWTGFNSDNETEIEHEDVIEVEVENWGWLANIFDDEADSGANACDYNTGNCTTITDDSGLTESTNDSMNYNYFGWPMP